MDPKSAQIGSRITAACHCGFVEKASRRTTYAVSQDPSNDIRFLANTMWATRLCLARQVASTKTFCQDLEQFSLRELVVVETLAGLLGDTRRVTGRHSPGYWETLAGLLADTRRVTGRHSSMGQPASLISLPLGHMAALEGKS
jgi:hypothetical protein